MPVRIDRVYTKTGDQGTTALVGGKRVAKDDVRIEAYGTVDELNAAIGLCRSLLTHLKLPKALDQELKGIFQVLQQDLFDLGADLATPLENMPAEKRKEKLRGSRIEEMEKDMDRWQETLPALKSFVLPGGSPMPAHLHFARTVARRAERHVVTLSKVQEIFPHGLRYLNRLSDYLFVLSRHVTKVCGEEETLWVY